MKAIARMYFYFFHLVCQIASYFIGVGIFEHFTIGSNSKTILDLLNDLLLFKHSYFRIDILYVLCN